MLAREADFSQFRFRNSGRFRNARSSAFAETGFQFQSNFQDDF
jgi:hypothetical protein